MFGKLTRLAIDLVAISTLLAGIARSTGYHFNTRRFKDATIRNLLDSYLAIGDNVFAFASGFAVSSSFFYRKIDQ
ncbi:putative protein [Vanrija pseudolonga]|uniref:DUF1748-domain-containing protein n=3 Tax=Vanrija TaxID=1851468 RepID=A0A7D8YYQ1_VANHU|nr:hypothetical protein VHUM_04362 [Vanrija humicola]WOO85582.1 purtative protein [Vanrija pseudolonga]